MSNSLASVHPELIPEWSERNLPLTPDKITFGSNKRVWWKGACGHEWETSVKARSKGEKCPICSGARVIEGINDLATLKPLLAQEWSEKNKLKPTEISVASHKKIIWKCKHGHEWEASVKSRTINGTGCPYCSHNKVLAGFNDLASQYPDIAAEWSDRNLPLLPTMVTAFANSKAWWKCKDCGNEWHTLISTRADGSRCPYCSGYTLLKGFNDLATTHPELAAEWSERNYPLMPDEVNAKSRHNVWWKCKTCGNEWKSVINARVKGTVCPVCADRAVLAGYNDLATTDRRLLAEWDYETNSLLPTQVSRRSMKSVWWKCSLGHSWKAKISDTRIVPTAPPKRTPSKIDVGICMKLIADTSPVEAKVVSAVNTTITNTSSTDAPAKINCGILLSVPYPSSISFIILGTTTAGDTAAMTLPMIAASRIDTPNNNGAKNIVPIISIHAGTKHIRIAGRPTFFKSEKFKDKPALVRIITNAICLKSPDIVSIESSTKFKQCGLNTIPTIIIPSKLGNFIFENIHPTSNPNNKIIAILVNI